MQSFLRSGLAPYLAWLAGPEVAGATGQHRGPDGGISGLLAGAEEEHAVRGQQLMDAGQQGLARLVREIEHDVTQEDDVEAVITAVEGQR